MATANPWTPAEDAILRDGYATGLSKAKIAAKLDGRTASAVGNRARTLGLKSDRTQTVAAVEARVIDAKARRAAAALTELAILEHDQAQVRAAQQGKGTLPVILKGSFGVEEIRDVSDLPARDRRDLASARSASAATIARLDVADGAGDAKSAALDVLAAIRADVDARRTQAAS